MRHPQVIVFEPDPQLARQLDGLWAEQRWALREPRDASACLELATAGPTVLVIRLGRRRGQDTHREETDPIRRGLELLDRAAATVPDVPVVVVGDVVDPVLADLARDLGARFVLFPPTTRDPLPTLVIGLMASALDADRHAGDFSPEAMR